MDFNSLPTWVGIASILGAVLWLRRDLVSHGKESRQRAVDIAVWRQRIEDRVERLEDGKDRLFSLLQKLESEIRELLRRLDLKEGRDKE